MQQFFADIIIPVPLAQTFTYAIPEDFLDEVLPGKRVEVQFGRSKIYAGIIFKVHEKPPENYIAKSILSVIDGTPIVKKEQLALWQWMAKYYMCSLGEIMLAALPSGLRMDSESVIQAINIPADISFLKPREQELLQVLLLQHELSLKQLMKITGIKSIHRYVKKWYDRGWIKVREEIKSTYSVKTQLHVLLHQNFRTEEKLNTAFESLLRATKQADILTTYLMLAGDGALTGFPVKSSTLIKRAVASPAAIKALVKKGILIEEEVQVGRIRSFKSSREIPALSPKQKNVFTDIKKSFNWKKNVLLHGVTGSGKTEVYAHLAQEIMHSGKSVLYLLPEIALTTQMIHRLGNYFGEQMHIYHSAISSEERTEIWLKLVDSNKPVIVVGVRSSVFLPFQNLGLIIVDEEHDASYKQFEPAPRYHARDVAIWVGKNQNASVLLGTATPSVESYWLAQQGNLQYVALNHRFGDALLPEIQCVDLRKDVGKKAGSGIFSHALKNKIEEIVASGKQVILFQNRRGYVPRLQCHTCGYVSHCVNCDIALTYHKYRQRLSCHYCGHYESPFSTCPACESTRVEYKGFGTEKIEEEIELIFPEMSVERMDYDTTRGQKKLETIIEKFEGGEVDVLVGTQMVTKGLDFKNVGLVGVLSVEHLLSFPDFRSYERTFQLITQVAGRAGRNKERGLVLLQTYDPHLYLLKQVVEGNGKGFYLQELNDRKSHFYPPFVRLIQFMVKHKDRGRVDEVSKRLAQHLKIFFGNMVLGPEYPMVERVRGQYQKQIMLKYKREFDVYKIREKVKEALENLGMIPETKGVRIVVDVDPT